MSEQVQTEAYLPGYPGLLRRPRPLVLLAALAVSWQFLPQEARAQGSERSGEQIVKQQCVKCHQTGKGGAPKIGDRAAWIPRAAQGLDAVVRSAIKGHGGMPARGGMADLTDPEMRKATIYMLNKGAGPAK